VKGAFVSVLRLLLCAALVVLVGGALTSASQAGILAGKLVPAAGAAAPARSCGWVGFERASDNGAFKIRATRVSCRIARAVASGSRDHGPRGRPGATYFYKARGFRCWGRELSTPLPDAEYHCRRRSSRVTFHRI